MTSLEQAFDLVGDVVRDAWEASAITNTYKLMWSDTGITKPGELFPKGSSLEPYGVVTMNPLTSGQTTQGRRRFATTEIVTVQIFTPLGDGGLLARQMSQVVASGLRNYAGSASGVWFFDIIPQRIGETDAGLQWNVDASFRYQETAS